MKPYTIPLLVSLGFLCGGALVYVVAPRTAASESCDAVYRFLNADINCAEEEKEAARIETMEQAVTKYVRVAEETKKAMRVGVFYRDLESRKWFGVNELEPFTPASLLKIPLAIAYYKLAEVDASLLQQQLLYTHHPAVGPPFAAHLEDGSIQTVETLIEQVLVHSDNNATIALSTNLQGDYEHNVFFDLGVTAPDENVDYLSAKTYGAIFRALYNASYLRAPYSEKILDSMSRASFREGLVAGVPSGTVVAHKFGYRINPDGTSELHDCGVVYHPKKPFIICVMTEGSDPNMLKTVIADIARLVWGIV